MTLLLAVLAGMLLAGGAVIVVAASLGVFGRRAPSRSSTGLWTKAVDGLRSLSVRARVMVVVALACGVVATLWTGWPILLVVVPLAVLGVPFLLSEPPQRDIELLESLDRWVRGMTATMASGKSITDALRLGARTPPPALAEPLVLLVRRIDDRWRPEQALAALADDLDSPSSDAVIASLMLAAQRGGTGAVATLGALADSVQDRLKVLREVEAERAKPRIVVRQVSVITLVVLGGAMLIGREFLAPYGTPTGQVLLTTLLVLYAGSLLMLRRMTLPRERARILRSAS